MDSAWRHPAHGDPTSWLGEKMQAMARFLRDSCPCPQCVNPSSGQKSFATTDIPQNIRVRHVKVSADFDLEVDWENDIPSASPDHKSLFPRELLRDLRFNFAKRNFHLRWKIPDRMIPAVTWDLATITDTVQTIDYAQWMNSEEAVWRGLFDLEAFGLVFIGNVPKQEDSVSKIALRIANMQETFYGRTWDVVSKPEAENVAYTNSYLGLHQDMLYLQSPPRIQALHCLENSCSGGESIYSDGFRAAETFELDTPEFWHLTNTVVRYHYDRHPYYYRNSHSVFHLNVPVNTETDWVARGKHLDASRIRAVWWSPPFQATNPPRIDDLPGLGDHGGHMDAMQKYSAALNDAKNVLEFKMKAGECVIFDNWRVMHGRKAFDTGSGHRHLRGTYISDEDFRAKLAGAPASLLDGALGELFGRFGHLNFVPGPRFGTRLSVAEWLKTPSWVKTGMEWRDGKGLTEGG
jgi:gamma-butyrobetaine dioxygenase